MKKYSEIGFILVVALLAGACGQSKVEYKREAGQGTNGGSSEGTASNEGNADNTLNQGSDNTDPIIGSVDPITDEMLNDTTTPENFDPTELEKQGIPVIRARKLREYQIGKERFSWQTWALPTNAKPALDNEEKLGLGDAVKDEDFNSGSAIRKAWENGSTLFNLEDASKSRCVFRNRLLESVPLEGGPKEFLPPPFGNHRLYCIDFRGGAHSFVQLERTLTWDKDSYRVRWLGSTTSKVIPAKGKSTLEFKLSSRIYAQQAFPKAVGLALSDRMDQLLNTVAVASSGQDCTIERIFFLRVWFKDGEPTASKLYVRTRHFALNDYFNWLDEDKKTMPIGYGSTKIEAPKLYPEAEEACRYQHNAWMQCLKSNGDPKQGVACERKVMNILNLNFADLLNTRVKGFASSRIFTFSRDEANGKGHHGALTLWYDLETPIDNPQGYNPLSLEDFQELTDIIDLKVTKKHQ